MSDDFDDSSGARPVVSDTPTPDVPNVPPAATAADSATTAPTTADPSVKLRPPELIRSAAVYGDMAAELSPIGEFETRLVMGAAQHEARRQLVHEAMMEAAIAAADSHRVHRRRPFLDKIESLRGSLEIWTIVRDDGFEEGEGLTTDFVALLNDIDPNATARKIGSTLEARRFVFLHNRAVASPRLRKLHARFAKKDESAKKGPLYDEYRRLQERLEKGTERLRDWIDARIARLDDRLAEAEKALDDDDARPDRSWAWYAETPEGRLFTQYHADAENASRRYLKMFDDHRRRLVRTDLRRQLVDTAYGTTTVYFGDIKVQMPARFKGLHPRAQLDDLIANFEYEKHFYPDRQPKENGYAAETLKSAGPAAAGEDTAMSELERQSREIRDFWKEKRRQWGDHPDHDGRAKPQ